MGRQDDLQQSVSSAVMQWLGSAAARPYQNSALQQLASVIPRVLGYRLLQIGGWPLQLDALGSSAMLHHWVLGGQTSQDATLPLDVCGEMSHLPIASQSVDAVLLPHCLEQTQNPHALLREVDRVLCARGQVIILGFNPMSLWHLARYIPRRGQAAYPRQARLYSCGRSCDWLGLLDFEVESLVHFGVVLPWTGDISAYSDARRWLAPFSQAYMIFARKRVVPLTPARRRWARLPDLGPAVLPEARVHRISVKNSE